MISVDRNRQEVVWRMPVDAARFYAEDVLAGYLTRHNDAGVSADLDALRAAADRLDPELADD